MSLSFFSSQSPAGNSLATVLSVLPTLRHPHVGVDRQTDCRCVLFFFAVSWFSNKHRTLSRHEAVYVEVNEDFRAERDSSRITVTCLLTEFDPALAKQHSEQEKAPLALTILLEI